MPGKKIHTGEWQGLSEKEAALQLRRFGKNFIEQKSTRRTIHVIGEIVREPMFILLVIACLLYFILGENSEGFMMVAAICFVTAISLYQESKSIKAIEALKQYTEPHITVIREGIEKSINSRDLVPGDLVLLSEGHKIPADATVLESNDLTVDESILTGESLPVEKDSSTGGSSLFQGTTVNSGKSLARVSATGHQTELARLGKSVGSYQPSKTLLQAQVGNFVRKLAYFGIIAFIIILVVNYFKTDSFTQSLLFGLTLAMAAIPEEIPVAFSSFMALGAFHMSRLGIITRHPQTIENLGAVSVICLDKTGTITENKMVVNHIYDNMTNQLIELEKQALPNSRVLEYAQLASESQPFDAMETAIAEAWQQSSGQNDYQRPAMIYEYPLEGRPPMMTHVYQIAGSTIAAAKGAVERIISVCRLPEEQADKILLQVKQLAEKGYRVLGVASALHADEEFPASQDDFGWKFEGLVSLYDPPRKSSRETLKQIREAGIQVKLLTGDYPETARNIAAQVEMGAGDHYFTGEQVLNMEIGELREKVKSTHLFARMFPEAKLKVIMALKANGEIVGMSGDGVNDGPALKAADIGIAMGKKGTDLARQASDLVLTDDDLQKITDAILQGRKIFSNLKKAIRYIISIHIPIILTAALPLLLGWRYPNIFTPIHVIFLELIMGPTCSIFFEREPVEENIMSRPPRSRNSTLFQKKELLVSILQGLVITAGVMLLYYFFMNNGQSLEKTRMIVFTTLVLSNIFLTFVNRSFTETMRKTLFYKNNLAPWILLISALFLGSLHFLPFFRNLFGLDSLAAGEFFLTVLVAMASTLWFEVFKIIGKK